MCVLLISHKFCKKLVFLAAVREAAQLVCVVLGLPIC